VGEDVEFQSYALVEQATEVRAVVSHSPFGARESLHILKQAFDIRTLQSFCCEGRRYLQIWVFVCEL
jgi:hypothetical protein